MDVPLDSERPPQSAILKKSPTAQSNPMIQQIADYKIALDMQNKLILTEEEEALMHYKHKRECEKRLLDEYHSTYDANWPSLAN